MAVVVEILSNCLLFCLVFGMAATVDVADLFRQIRNYHALLIGCAMQFIVLPFCGFVVVKMFQLPSTVGITLLVITSSPGGTFSNLWCSLFNADLALSVTMTAVSTILSTVMLPANLVLYTKWTYSAAVVKKLDWNVLYITIAVVLSGIVSGLIVSKLTGNSPRMHKRANRLGSSAGLILILMSIFVSSTDQQAKLWDQNASFYISVAMPVIIGMIAAVSLASYFELAKPERVAVTIESCNQNTGIATTVALAMFKTESELARALGVPLYYGIVEASCNIVFCLVCWKANWTKAPPKENLCRVLTESYEVHEEVEEEPEVVEVVLGGGDSQRSDLIFSRSAAGDYIVDEETLRDVELFERNKKVRRNQAGNEDPTECSESGDEVDGIVLSSLPPKKRGRRKYGMLQATSEEEGEMPVDSLESPDKKIPRVARAISNIRTRARGYHSQNRVTERQIERGTRLSMIPIESPTTQNETTIKEKVDDDDDMSL